MPPEVETHPVNDENADIPTMILIAVNDMGVREKPKYA